MLFCELRFRFCLSFPRYCELGSSVGIATGYGLDGPRIESRWGRDFPHLSRPASCTMATGSFPGVKSGRGVTLTLHPFKCRGKERVELYLYFPYGPYGLYRAAVPVQGCTLPFSMILQKLIPLKLKCQSVCVVSGNLLCVHPGCIMVFEPPNRKKLALIDVV